MSLGRLEIVKKLQILRGVHYRLSCTSAHYLLSHSSWIKIPGRLGGYTNNIEIEQRFCDASRSSGSFTLQSLWHYTLDLKLGASFAIARLLK
jgi:hypothetical protein